MSKRKKARYLPLRFRKADRAHNLQAAVQHWVHANGGSVSVIGGIEIITMPDEAPYKYRVAVGCLGRRPEKKPEAPK